jgi:carbon storage regulator CsrA
MLILERRAEQSIVFPSCGIVIRMLSINGRVAKVGIDAPENIAILRGEVATQSYVDNDSSSSSHIEHPYSANRDAAKLEQLRSDLLRVQLLRNNDQAEEADRLFESILLQLNAIDRPRSLESGVAETAYLYNSDATPHDVQILFVGHAQAAIEDDLRIVENRLGKMRCIDSADLAFRTIDFSEVDCVILDADQCSNIGLVLRSLRSMESNKSLCVICVSKFTPSLFGLSFDGSLFDGWILQPWDFSAILSHVQFALGLSGVESR